MLAMQKKEKTRISPMDIKSQNIREERDFLGHPVTKTLHCHLGGPRFNPWSGD